MTITSILFFLLFNLVEAFGIGVFLVDTLTLPFRLFTGDMGIFYDLFNAEDPLI